jgi:hypothetical protein
MENIKIKKIEEPIIEILYNGHEIGLCHNETEFLDLLVQIKENKSNLFSCRIYGIEDNPIYPISSSGRVKHDFYKNKNCLLRKLVDF